MIDQSTKRPSLPVNSTLDAPHDRRPPRPLLSLHADAPEGFATFREKAGLVLVLLLLVLIAALSACSATGAQYESSKTHPDGSSETRKAAFSRTKVRDDAPEAVGELLNLGGPLLPPWVMPAAAAALGAFGFDQVKRPVRQRREDRLWDEAYQKGRNRS